VAFLMAPKAVITPIAMRNEGYDLIAFILIREKSRAKFTSNGGKNSQKRRARTSYTAGAGLGDAWSAIG
jgi:hypothetical protein